MSDTKKKKKGDWKKVLLIIFLSLLLLALLAVAGLGIYMNHLLNQVTPYDPSNDIPIATEEAEKFLEEDPEAVPLDPDSDEDIPDLEELTIPEEVEEDPTNWDNVINIMLIGQDRRPGQGRQRSDTMILLTVNKAKGTITLTSFMRDQYVRIPGYKNNKMNAAYAFGGMKLLNETMETNFGVKIDGDVEVDFNNFEKIVNMLGGVDIKLTKSEVKYLNAGLHLTGTSRELVVGTNHLDGAMALEYSRLRAIDSDYRRAERQRTVVSALISRYKSLPLPEMIGMIDDMLPMVTTNMTKYEIIDYAVEVAPMLPSAQLSTMRIPVDGTFRQGIAKVRPGLAAWFQYDIDFEANRKTLQGIFAEN